MNLLFSAGPWLYIPITFSGLISHHILHSHLGKNMYNERLPTTILPRRTERSVAPRKTNMEPENEPLEEEISIKNHHFQVPC